MCWFHYLKTTRSKQYTVHINVITSQMSDSMVSLSFHVIIMLYVMAPVPLPEFLVEFSARKLLCREC